MSHSPEASSLPRHGVYDMGRLCVCVCVCVCVSS